MRRRKLQQILSLALSLVMVMSVSVPAFADEDVPDEEPAQEEEYKDPNEGKVLDPETGEYVEPDELERRLKQREAEAEKKRQEEEEAERKRQEEEEAEKQRLAEEERRQKEEEEKQRLAEEEEKKRQEEEAEKQRQAEAEEARKKAEEERKAAEEAEKQRLAAEEAERQRQAEQARKELEEQKKAQEEAERQRQAAEEAKKQAEEEQARKAAEEKAKREEEERKAAEEQKKAEEEAARKKAEAEKAEQERKAAEEAERKKREEEAKKTPVAARISVTSLANMRVGQDAKLSANPTGGEGPYTVTWGSDNPAVATVDQEGVVRAIAKGTAVIKVVAVPKTGEPSTETCAVTVEAATAPVAVTGGSAVSLTQGQRTNLNATVNGGSGKGYDYVWEVTAGDDVVKLSQVSSAGNGIYGSQAGSATVTLTAFDKEDPSLYGSTSWTVTVTGGQKDAVAAKLSNETLSVKSGEEKTLTVTATGGSGDAKNYTYSWKCNASGVISMSQNGSTVTVKGLKGGTASVEVFVTDTSTGQVSGTVYCTVKVESSEAGYSTSASATVGSSLNLNTIASSISNEFNRQFGSQLNYGASVVFDTTSASAGGLQMQDDTRMKAGTSYTYATMQDSVFVPSAAGTFSTKYTITDGGRQIGGTIEIFVTGGTALTDATLSTTSIRMSQYSDQLLNVNVQPKVSDFTVSWSSSNDNIAYISGSGSSVYVRSQGRTGTATITAVITDGRGSRLTRECTVRVVDDDRNSKTYSPTLELTYGSDYHGTTLADSLRRQFRNVYGVTPGDDATIVTTYAGDSRIARTRLANGGEVRANVSYTLYEYSRMYVEVNGTGSFSSGYRLTYRGNTLSGDINIRVVGTRLDVTMNPTTMNLATYGNQYIDLSIYPRNESVRISWDTNNSRIARIEGSGSSVRVINDGTTGTATVTATIRDSYGGTITKRCTVNVSNNGRGNTSSTYNYSPRITTNLNGSAYTGTSTSEAMAQQFKNAFGMTLPDSATIRFNTTGNSNVAVTRLANGSPLQANTNYTFGQYKQMYVENNGAGSFSVPYTLTYNGKSLTGSVNMDVTKTDLSVSLELPNTNAFQFSANTSNGQSGMSMITNAINNAVGSYWSYLVFGTTNSATGTLFLNSGRSPLGSNKISASSIGTLYFAPTKTGSYDVPFSVYSNNGSALATGRLFITVGAEQQQQQQEPAKTYSQGSAQFGDVVKDAFYDTPIGFAVDRGITNGTGKDSSGKETFSPNKTCITAEIITFLWRSQGKPAATIDNPFTDVKTGDYFYQPALWAYQNGLVSGTKFNAMTDCTRAATVTYMWKLAGRPSAAQSTFSDVTRGTDEAAAIDWALSKNITGGMGNDASGKPTFGPSLTCTRGQIVTFLYRAYA